MAIFKLSRIKLEDEVMQGLNLADTLSSVNNGHAKQIYEQTMKLYEELGSVPRIEERKKRVEDNLKRYARAK